MKDERVGAKGYTEIINDYEPAGLAQGRILRENRQFLLKIMYEELNDRKSW